MWHHLSINSNILLHLPQQMINLINNKRKQGSSCSLRKMEMGINFVPTMPILTRVELLLYKKRDVNDVTLSIKKICFRRRACKSYVEFDIEDINVIPGEVYYIILLVAIM